MVARTVSVTVATCGYFTSIFLFTLGNAIEESQSHFLEVVWVVMGSTLVLFLAVSVPTIISLRRNPELVKQPSGRPLERSTARMLWTVGGTCILASPSCLVVYSVTDSGWFRVVQFVACIGGVIAFGVLGRRPVQPDGIGPRLIL